MTPLLQFSVAQNCAQAIEKDWRLRHGEVEGEGDFQALLVLTGTRTATVSDFPLSAARPVSAITDTATIRSMTPVTSLRSQIPSESLVSRSPSRIVWCAMASAKCSPQYRSASRQLGRDRRIAAANFRK